MTVELSEANETVAFLTSDSGYDVAKIERYTRAEVSPEHATHVLTDTQWQCLIDLIAGYLNEGQGWSGHGRHHP